MINIRKAKIEDLENIKDLNKAVMVNNPLFDEDIKEDFAHTSLGTEYFIKSIENKGGIFLLAEENNQLVGYINGNPMEVAYRKSRYFEIENLGVISQLKGKGIGTRLLEEFAKAVKSKNFEKIYLNCYFKNTEALNFYRSRGFKEIDLCLEKEI